MAIEENQAFPVVSLLMPWLPTTFGGEAVDSYTFIIPLAVFIVVAAAFFAVRESRRGRATSPDGMRKANPALEPVPSSPVEPSDPIDEEPPTEFVLTVDGPKMDGPEYLVRVLDEDRSLVTPPLPVQTGHSGPPLSALGLVPGKLVENIPILNLALRKGKIVEIVGPPEVLKGLRNGTMALMRKRKNGKDLGTVVWNDSKKISGQAELQKMRTFVAPAMAFQLLAIATSQYYLVEINQQLERILEGIQEILRRMQLEAWGKSRGARRTVLEVADHLDNLPENSQEFWSRLGAAEQGANAIIEESERNIRQYCDRVHQQAGGKPNREEVGKLLETSGPFLEDVSIYFDAVRSRLAWFRVVLAHDYRWNPSLGETRKSQMFALLEQCNEGQNLVSRTAAELSGMAEASVIPSGPIEHIQGLFEPWTKNNERFLSGIREFTDALQETCSVQLGRQDQKRILTYQLRQGKDGAEWDVREEAVLPAAESTEETQEV